MVYRRIERRMGVHHIDSINEYVRYLKKNEQEIVLRFKDLLIGVTNFFRDRKAWESLKQEIMSKLLSTKEEGSVIRVWALGCSTGEEAYSLAIVLKECLHAIKQKHNITVQIFATDIDSDAIDVARQGTYPANIASDVGSDRLTRFLKEDDKYRVKKEIRDLIVFTPQNVIMDPPLTKLDILCCRNLFIYFTPELQKNSCRYFITA
jgi:chemotaxis methyl-accepting protein methylase